MLRTIDYMVKHFGLLREFARRMVEQQSAIVEIGVRLGSYPYYIAGEVFKAECKRLGTANVPKEWFDPNWVEPSEYEENETDE